MGAAPGNFGTVRAQLALRQMWVWIDSVPVVKPEVHVFRAAERFDDTGRLTDATTRELIVELLEALRTTIERLRMHQPAAPAAG
jgi:chromate reductase